MAIFFWLFIFATILVLAAALSPALAHRRDLRLGRAARGAPGQSQMTEQGRRKQLADAGKRLVPRTWSSGG